MPVGWVLSPSWNKLHLKSWTPDTYYSHDNKNASHDIIGIFNLQCFPNLQQEQRACSFSLTGVGSWGTITVPIIREASICFCVASRLSIRDLEIMQLESGWILTGRWEDSREQEDIEFTLQWGRQTLTQSTTQYPITNWNKYWERNQRIPIVHQQKWSEKASLGRDWNWINQPWEEHPR